MWSWGCQKALFTSNHMCDWHMRESKLSESKCQEKTFLSSITFPKWAYMFVVGPLGKHFPAIWCHGKYSTLDVSSSLRTGNWNVLQLFLSHQTPTKVNVKGKKWKYSLLNKYFQLWALKEKLWRRWERFKVNNRKLWLCKRHKKPFCQSQGFNRKTSSFASSPSTNITSSLRCIINVSIFYPIFCRFHFVMQRFQCIHICREEERT